MKTVEEEHFFRVEAGSPTDAEAQAIRLARNPGTLFERVVSEEINPPARAWVNGHSECIDETP